MLKIESLTTGNGIYFTFLFPNFKFSRVGVTSHSLDKVLAGEDELVDFLDEIVLHFEAQQLEAIINEG